MHCRALLDRARATLSQPEPVVDDDFVTAVNDAIAAELEEQL